MTFSIDTKLTFLRVYIIYIKYKSTFVVSSNTLIPMNACEIQSVLGGYIKN